MKRTDALNHVIKENGYKSFLEIGVQQGDNRQGLKVDEYIGVDPDKKTGADFYMTSDDFFKKEAKSYDMIFIDGMHTAEQALKDYNNAIKHLNEGGCIAFHDVLPHNELYTRPEWCGSVWRLALGIASNVPVVTANWDHGVMFVFDPKPVDAYETGAYPGIEELRNKLNTVDKLEELTSAEQELAKAYEGLEDAPLFKVADEPYGTFTDDELKDAHKEKFGFKPKGKFNREKVIAKLNEA